MHAPIVVIVDVQQTHTSSLGRTPFWKNTQAHPGDPASRIPAVGPRAAPAYQKKPFPIVLPLSLSTDA
jgi:hypothetical protein